MVKLDKNMTTKEDILKKWFVDNSWNLIVTFVAIIAAYSYLNARVMAVELKTKDYPSQDWFILKFQNIDDNFTQTNNLIKDHIKEGK